MNLREWGEKMLKRAEAMQANRDRDALGIANDLKALVQLRIQTSGVNFAGSKFSPYSEGYKKQRKKAGAQTTVVDFTRTGEMWGNITPEVTQSNETSTVVEITARTPNNQMKLRGALTQPAASPRGNILLPSEDEIAIAQEANKERVIKYLRSA